MVGEASDVVDVDADEARGQQLAPGLEGHEAEPRQHLGVTDVVPVARDGGGMLAQQVGGLLGQRELVVAQAALEAERDAEAGGAGSELGEGAARGLEPRSGGSRALAACSLRSEERRVGKGGRAAW